MDKKQKWIDELTFELSNILEDVNLVKSQINNKIKETNPFVDRSVYELPVDGDMEHIINEMENWDYKTIRAVYDILQHKELQTQFNMRNLEEQDEWVDRYVTSKLLQIENDEEDDWTDFSSIREYLN